MRRHTRATRASALFALSAMLCWSVAGAPAHAGSAAELWDAIRTGRAFAIMRHALAPGTGDPRNFALGDCSTQRNLSDDGRAQARRVGERFRANGITRASVFSSQWCRCRETAERLEIGAVADLPSLNSFFGRPSRRTPQTQALKSWLARNRATRPLVLVTHQVNIRALTGKGTGSGEVVIARIDAAGTITVLGAIE